MSYGLAKNKIKIGILSHSDCSYKQTIFINPNLEVITVRYKLVHLDYNDNKIFDIREMSEQRAYNENCNLTLSGARKRWLPARERDRTNAKRNPWQRN